jgi:hypothetical protein
VRRLTIAPSVALPLLRLAELRYPAVVPPLGRLRDPPGGFGEVFLQVERGYEGALSSIENGRVNLTIETCVKIAVGLRLRVKDVIPGGLEDLVSSGQESGPRSHVQKRAG